MTAPLLKKQMEFTASWNTIYKIEHELKCSDNFHVWNIYSKSFPFEFVFVGRVKTQYTSARKIIDFLIEEECEKAHQEMRRRIENAIGHGLAYDGPNNTCINFE